MWPFDLYRIGECVSIEHRIHRILLNKQNSVGEETVWAHTMLEEQLLNVNHSLEINLCVIRQYSNVQKCAIVVMSMNE